MPESSATTSQAGTFGQSAGLGLGGKGKGREAPLYGVADNVSPSITDVPNSNFLSSSSSKLRGLGERLFPTFVDEGSSSSQLRNPFQSTKQHFHKSRSAEKDHFAYETLDTKTVRRNSIPSGSCTDTSTQISNVKGWDVGQQLRAHSENTDEERARRRSELYKPSMRIHTNRLASGRHRSEEKMASRRAEQERTCLEAAQFWEAAMLDSEQEYKRRRQARAKEEAARLSAQKALVAAQEARRIQEEAAYMTQHVVLGSTLVTCGAGLDIRGVVCGFDSCRLTIRNLPLNTKAQEVVELFTQQGISCSDIHIISILPMTGNRLEAQVLTSANHGSLIAIGLDGLEFRNEKLRFESTANTSAHAMGESRAQQVDTLTISWPSPTTTIIAQYPSIHRACTQARALDRKIFEGFKIRAEMIPPPTATARSSSHRHDCVSVKLTGLPLGTPAAVIYKWAGTTSARMLQSEIYDSYELLRDLRQHLESLPNTVLHPFEIVKVQEEEGTSAVKVRFGSWEEANAARATLEDKHLRSNYPLFRISHPAPFHFESTIPIQQFKSQRRRWEVLADIKSDNGLQLHALPSKDRELVRIKLSGSNRKAVGALKVRVETLIAGERLGATYWHRSFLWREGRAFLTTVFLETGVYVRSDFKIQALRIYGEGEARETALMMVEDEVTRLSQQDQTVTLRRELVGYFLRKGLAVLKELLGKEAVTLDLASTPCKLTMRGGEDASHTLSNLMDQATIDWDTGKALDRGNVICPICYDAVSHPVLLRCHHVYCTACIRHYLTSATETKIFPLVCIGNEATCNAPIPIPLVKRFLIPQKYEQLVNSAFTMYLDSHPQDFRYCTTPDCTQIYRANTTNMLKCPSCFAEVCSSCHEEGHDGMSCVERRTQKDEEEEQLNDQWASAHSVKRCPGCQVYIEKINGCNHISCRCGAHICWACLQTFSSDKIYKHMRSVHGGVYDGDAEQQDVDLQQAMDLQYQLDGGLEDVIPFPLPRVGQIRQRRGGHRAIAPWARARTLGGAMRNLLRRN